MRLRIPKRTSFLSLANYGTSNPVIVSTLLFEDFESSVQGGNQVPSGWSVINGTVDVGNINSWTYYPFTYLGTVVDLDGSTSQSGLLLKESYLEAGKTYRLGFKLAGNWRWSSDDTVSVSFGDTSKDLVVQNNQLFTEDSVLFCPSKNGYYLAGFQNQGGDNIGALLDDVRIDEIEIQSSTYTIATSSSSVNEGDILTTTITTANVADGTILYWAMSGTEVNSTDFSSGSLTGSGTVKNGKLMFTHILAKDALTEGDEKVTITLYDASKKSVGTSTVSIKDTSKTPVKPGVLTDISDLTKTISLNRSGTTYSWNAQLTTKPTEDLVVTYKSSDTTEGLFSNGKDTISLTFTSANWNQSQKVTIQGVDDDVNDGDIKFTASGTAKSRLDQTYWGRTLSSLWFLTPYSSQP